MAVLILCSIHSPSSHHGVGASVIPDDDAIVARTTAGAPKLTLQVKRVPFAREEFPRGVMSLSNPMHQGRRRIRRLWGYYGIFVIPVIQRGMIVGRGMSPLKYGGHCKHAKNKKRELDMRGCCAKRREKFTHMHHLKHSNRAISVHGSASYVSDWQT